VKKSNSYYERREENNMKTRPVKFLTTSLVLVCVLTLASFPQTIADPQKPKLFVDPKDNVFSTETTVVGDTFTVDIATSGWELPGLYGYEFKLYYDPTLLNITSAEYPDGHFLDWTGNFPTPVIIDYEAGTALFGGILLGDVPGSTGSGVFATVTLQIITAPPPILSCDLELKDIALLDPEGIDIPEYDVEHGYYELSPPRPPVYLKVEPEVVGAFELGEQVMIDITINDIRAEDRLVGVEWKVAYDTTLLQLSNVTEGDFMKYFAELSGVESPYTIFGWHKDVGVVFIFILPLPDGTYPGPFPEGSGTLATITFNAIEMPEETTETDLELFDVTMLDADGNEMLYDHLESGVYIAPKEAADLNLDRKIDIQDLYIFGSSFGSYPEHPRWDARADINSDGKINILDGVIIAKAFHT
jgi:hypothetical protein